MFVNLCCTVKWIIPSLLSFPPTAAPDSTSLAHRRAPSWLSMLYRSFLLAICFTHVVYECQCCFLNRPHLLFPLLCPQVCSVHLHFYSCPANTFISTTFLDSLYMHWWWCSIAQSCLTLCISMDCSTPGLPVPHHLPKFAQVHVHCIGDVIQPSYPLTPSSSALSLSQHQGLFQWVSCSCQVTKIWALQQKSFQWVFRDDVP